MENIIIGIATIIILPLVFGFFYYLKEKEEKKIIYGSEFIVKMSKGIVLFFLIWMIIFLLGMISALLILFLYNGPDKNQLFWIIEIVCILFFLIGMLGFALCKFNYIVVKNEGILVHKMFKKPTLIHYDDIAYINSHPFGTGEVSGYDQNGIPLFAVDYYHVGAEKLKELLHNKGYPLLPKPYPTNEMKENLCFQRYKKKSKFKISFWFFLLFGILLILLGILVHSQCEFSKYENYKVSGMIEKVEVDEDHLTIYLQGDDVEYYVNNIVFDELDEKVFDVLKSGESIDLYVAYIDEYKRYHLSQIEINKIVYLDMNVAEKAEYFNYKAGIITSYVMIGVGGFFMILSGVFVIKLLKSQKELKKEIC